MSTWLLSFPPPLSLSAVSECSRKTLKLRSLTTRSTASKSISKTSSKLQNETSTSQIVEPTFRRPSPIQIPTRLQSVPSTPKRLSKSEVSDGANPITHQKGPTDSLPNKIPTKTNSLDQKLIQQGHVVELLQLTESMSLEKVTEDQKKKNSEQGSGKNSCASTKVSDDTSSVTKTSESAKVSDRAEFVESGKSSMCRASTCSDVSDESTSSTISSSVNKPHKANDSRWEAIQSIRAKDGVLGLSHFRLLKRLGCGDIGSVYLSELNGTKSYFAMKVMDKVALASRKKLLRAQTEKEILQCLDHPFLPTLYTHFATEKFSCLVMEFCPGGDLHTLRQRQPGKYFSEHAVKFYVAEVLLALEYLHMLGIIYRDLKPENILVREDGHIMLSDFDLSLRCSFSPTLVNSISSGVPQQATSYCIEPPSCIQPSCAVPTSCFSPRFFSPSKSKKNRNKTKTPVESSDQVIPLPELVAEPTDARSMSFVGTHEYLAPEIIRGDGHGSAVDWWTLGIFIYELSFGKTPFKGSGNRATLFNVVGQPLRFPESPAVSFAAKDLIRGLLVKEPQHRLGVKRGATEIKQHPFFEGVNWALIRCASPPEVPKPVVIERAAAPAASGSKPKADAHLKGSDNYLEFDFF